MEYKFYNDEKKKSVALMDWVVSLALGGIATLLYLICAVDSVPVGLEKVVLSWCGGGVQSYSPFPISGAIAKVFGASKYVSAFAGGLSVILLFHIVSFFIRECFGDQYSSSHKRITSRIGGIVAALIFIFTPSAFSAATHPGPAALNTLFALVALAVFVPFFKSNTIVTLVAAFISGAILSLASADTITILFLMPLCGTFAWISAVKRGSLGYLGAGLFLFAFLLTIPFAIMATGNLDMYIQDQKQFFADEGGFGYSVCAFGVYFLIFIISLFSCATVFGEEKKDGLVAWIFHFIMSILVILAVTPLFSVSSILGSSGYQPMMATIFPAAVSGYLASYWWNLVKTSSRSNNFDGRNTVVNVSEKVGYVGGIGYSLILLSVLMIYFIRDVDFSEITFSGKIAEDVLNNMGERTWIVTDGLIDKELELAAIQKGKKLNIVSFARENDDEYIKALSNVVLTEQIGGSECSKELVKLLAPSWNKKQRLVPFIEHWFKNDPEVSKKVVVWGVPHLWMNVGKGYLPELYFFSCDEGNKKFVDWTFNWNSVKDLLFVPEGWGSYRCWTDMPQKSNSNGRIRARNPRKLLQRAIRRMIYDTDSDFITENEKKLYNLRRHIGFLATSQGNYYHFNGLKLYEEGKIAEGNEELEKAFKLYELVLNEIDPDNLAALFNEDVLARKSNFLKAIQKRTELDKGLEAFKKDPNRHYHPFRLSLLYGSICDPEFMIKYAQMLSKSGQKSQGLFLMRRAIDLIPTEQRRLVELNLLVHYFSDGTAENKAEARRICQSEIKREPNNRVALARLSELEAQDGNLSLAIEYLERALKGVENDSRYAKLMARLHLMRNEFRDAELTLRKARDENPKDIQTLALLTQVLIRMADNLGDVSANAKLEKRKTAIFKEVEGELIPAMEFLAKESKENDAVYRSVRALMLMRKGGESNIREARDSFDVVIDRGMGSSHTSDMILSLDMQLNDKEHAEERASRVLTIRPDDPLANYIMGSIVLHRGDNEAAEKYFKKAVSGKRVIPLAFNDMAEVLRRRKAFDEAEVYARKAVEQMPNLYVAWETLGSILMDAGKSFDEAEKYVQKACDLSKNEQGGAADVRMLISLARVQIRRNQMNRAQVTIREVQRRLNELTDFEKQEFQELMKSVK